VPSPPGHCPAAAPCATAWSAWPRSPEHGPVADLTGHAARAAPKTAHTPSTALAQRWLHRRRPHTSTDFLERRGMRRQEPTPKSRRCPPRIAESTIPCAMGPLLRCNKQPARHTGHASGVGWPLARPRKSLLHLADAHRARALVADVILDQQIGEEIRLAAAAPPLGHLCIEPDPAASGTPVATGPRTPTPHRTPSTCQCSNAVMSSSSICACALTASILSKALACRPAP